MTRAAAWIGAAILSLAPGLVQGQQQSARWNASLLGMAYFVPDEPSFLVFMGTADRSRLHLEARYNYEDLYTASAFAGISLTFGSKLNVVLTPMAGGAVGRTDGLAPAMEATVTWGPLELYSEGEYLFDLHDSANDFFYVWSELTADVTPWLALGVAGQKTKVVREDVDVQRGLLATFTHRGLSATGYLFNLDDDPFYVLSLSLSF